MKDVMVLLWKKTGSKENVGLFGGQFHRSRKPTDLQAFQIYGSDISGSMFC